MKILPSKLRKHNFLPLNIKIGFEAIFDYLEKTAEDQNHHFCTIAKLLLEDYRHLTILKDGFEDYNLLIKYSKEIDRLLDIVFPDILQNDEIKAVSIPFDQITFKLSDRFRRIMEDAGNGFELNLRHANDKNMYISACIFILVHYYKVKIKYERPFYYDIPSIEDGFTRNYRVKYNKDFFKITKAENAPNISDKDIKILLDNFKDIEIWKEKFPIHSYEFNGFGVINLFDVTSDQLISDVKEKLLRTDENAFLEMGQSISNLFSSNTLKFDFSVYYLNNNKIAFRYNYKRNNVLTYLNDDYDVKDNIFNMVFIHKKVLAISNVETYANKIKNEKFYNYIKEKEVKSILLVPIILNEELFGVLELISKKRYELNSINAEKIKDIIPVFRVSALRYIDEYVNRLESIIQRHYTSIHPTVKWKFYNAAEEHLINLESKNTSNNIKSIVFKDVIPLYGQCDIKGSSIARNEAVRLDLLEQLNLVKFILEKTILKIDQKKYQNILLKTIKYLNNISIHLKAFDEEVITDFLKNDIFDCFNSIKNLEGDLNSEIKNYYKIIDENSRVIYKWKRKFDTSVNQLNDLLVNFIDDKQIQAQEMFSHYFERYKTDGVDYTMYVGQSLIQNNTFKKKHLLDLRLWQLNTMCQLEKEVYKQKGNLAYSLEICSLILVYSTPLDLKFRMGEKKFDVDGHQNVKYEILKKRIDKSFIKNTKTRLTEPGKIVIVYSQPKEKKEYLSYISQLQSQKLLLNKIETIAIEDTLGVSGLKALRVSIDYQ